MALSFEKKYSPCSFGDFATKLGVTKQTFYLWITREDWHTMIDLGYLPHKNLLVPAVVKYLSDKFLLTGDEETQNEKKAS